MRAMQKAIIVAALLVSACASPTAPSSPTSSAASSQRAAPPSTDAGYARTQKRIVRTYNRNPHDAPQRTPRRP